MSMLHLASLQKVRSRTTTATNKPSSDSDSTERRCEPCLTITPFPELSVTNAKTRTNISTTETAKCSGFTNIVNAGDQNDTSEANLRDNKLPTLKSAMSSSSSSGSCYSKTRESYWSFRKAVPRFNLSAATNSLNKPSRRPEDGGGDTFSPSPLPPIHSPSALTTTTTVLKPFPRQKPFVRSFRYSSMVESLVNLLDHVRENDPRPRERFLERVFNTFPALDVHGLLVARRRLARCPANRGRPTRHRHGVDKTNRGTRSHTPMIWEEGSSGMGVFERSAHFCEWLLSAMTQHRNLSVLDSAHKKAGSKTVTK